MPIQMRTREFGDHYFYLPYLNGDGGVQTILDHYCHRGPHTSNKVSMSLGVPWRNPSDYHVGVIDISRLSRSDLVWEVFPGYLVFLRNYVGSDWEACLSMPNIWAYSHPYRDVNAMNQAETEALNKLGDSRAELGTALLEARKSAGMLATAAVKLVKLLLHAKRGQWSKIPREFGIRNATARTRAGALARDISGDGTRSLANYYLEWKFGWQPLAADIKGAHDILQQNLQKALMLTARKGVTIRNDVTIRDTVVPPDAYDLNGYCVREHRVTIDARLEDEHLHMAQQAGLINPLSIAWELVPWSFVADWFVPVGNTLQALTDTRGLTFVGGSRSVTGLLQFAVTHRKPSYWVGDRATLHGASFGNDREALSAFPVPKLYYQTKSPFSTSHILSALALIRQLYHGR